MPGGTGTPGLTSEANSPWRRPPRTLTAAISVIAAAPGDHPVVSRSITENSSCANSRSVGSGGAEYRSRSRTRILGRRVPAPGLRRARPRRAIRVGLVTETTVGLPTDISAAGAPRSVAHGSAGPARPVPARPVRVLVPREMS